MLRVLCVVCNMAHYPTLLVYTLIGTTEDILRVELIADQQKDSRTTRSRNVESNLMELHFVILRWLVPDVGVVIFLMQVVYRLFYHSVLLEAHYRDLT